MIAIKNGNNLWRLRDNKIDNTPDENGVWYVGKDIINPTKDIVLTYL